MQSVLSGTQRVQRPGWDSCRNAHPGRHTRKKLGGSGASLASLSGCCGPRETLPATGAAHGGTEDKAPPATHATPGKWPLRRSFPVGFPPTVNPVVRRFPLFRLQPPDQRQGDGQQPMNTAVIHRPVLPPGPCMLLDAPQTRQHIVIGLPACLCIERPGLFSGVVMEVVPFCFSYPAETSVFRAVSLRWTVRTVTPRAAAISACFAPGCSAW